MKAIFLKSFTLVLTRFKVYVILTLLSYLISIVFLLGKHYGKTETINDLSLSELNDDFNKDKLITMLKQLNVKYPHIVLAQSIVETGYWQSNIFLKNNNLFGMKEAKQRITTAQGTKYGHAVYNHWRESVYDYSFYQTRYLAKTNSEEEYLNILNKNYAENPNYKRDILDIIKKENLKEFF